MNLTTRRTTDYRLNNTIFRVTYGDITKQMVDVIVSSDDNFLSMGGGVSQAILNAGGETIQMDTRKLVPINIGNVAVTSAGKITAKYIFHAVTIDYINMIYPSEETIRAATLKCMQLADTLNIQTIAFPALGTGVGGFPFQLAAEVMTHTIADYLIGETRIELVILTLFENEMARESDLNLFYEKSVACASVYTQSKRLNSLIAELKEIVDQMNKPSLSKRIEELRIELIQSQKIFIESQKSVEHLNPISNSDGVRIVSEEIIDISTKVQDTVVWTDKQLELTVLKTKLEGLQTLLNIQIANLYRLEIKKAKYGLDAPLYLENAIEELKIEISNTETSINEIKKQVASLYIRQG